MHGCDEPMVCDICSPEWDQECDHLFIADVIAAPYDRAGHCAIYALCEDCGEELGRIGIDSVL